MTNVCFRQDPSPNRQFNQGQEWAAQRPPAIHIWPIGKRLNSQKRNPCYH